MKRGVILGLALAVVGMASAAVERGGPRTPGALLPAPSRPARPRPPSEVRPPVGVFYTDMPMIVARIIAPNRIVLPGPAPTMPGPQVRVIAPNARDQTYVTPMPIIVYGSPQAASPLLVPRRGELPGRSPRPVPRQGFLR